MLNIVVAIRYEPIFHCRLKHIPKLRELLQVMIWKHAVTLGFILWKTIEALFTASLIIKSEQVQIIVLHKLLHTCFIYLPENIFRMFLKIALFLSQQSPIINIEQNKLSIIYGLSWLKMIIISLSLGHDFSLAIEYKWYNYIYYILLPI